MKISVNTCATFAIIKHCNGFNVFHRTNYKLIFQVFLRPHINGGFYLYNLLNGGNHDKCILSVCHQSFKSCIIWLKLTQAELLPQVETQVVLVLLRTDMWLKVAESPAQSPILDLLVLIWPLSCQIKPRLCNNNSVSPKNGSYWSNWTDWVNLSLIYR